MASVFHRRLVVPLWAIVLFTVAFTAPPPAMLFPMPPPTTLFVIAVLGSAGIIIMMLGLFPWLRTSRSVVRVPPSRRRDQASAAGTMTAGTCVRTLDEPNRSGPDYALDLVRMDDDGGWQMAPPRA